MADLSADPFVLHAATALFAVAVLHTFLCGHIQAWANRAAEGSMTRNFLHFLAEVEVVFGFWAFVFMLTVAVARGSESGVAVLASAQYTEAAFVFVIMAVASTRPIMTAAAWLLDQPARLFPFAPSAARYVSYLILGPLLGSLITEPAAMTVTALLLKDALFDRPEVSPRFKYASLGLLFVNVSIGGTLSHIAAPPVVMVAHTWGWDLAHMLAHFGWKAALAVVGGTLATAALFFRELRSLDGQGMPKAPVAVPRMPLWVIGVHVAFIGAIVAYHATMAFFVPLFLIFVGWTEVSQEYQTPLKIRESLLVGFFLGGLVVLGQFQEWWLKPLLSQLGDLPLYLGAIGLTAITDNAALTYLGSLVPGLSDSAKYFLVAGAVTGGGLTIIANAPNPAGHGILRDSFGADGIRPGSLLMGALPYTALAAACFLLP